jgi:hypothetical protein
MQILNKAIGLSTSFSIQLHQTIHSYFHNKIYCCGKSGEIIDYA